jgi:(1->4)-alpha-D-glucan 1-alpha-D-glucosylmutase
VLELIFARFSARANAGSEEARRFARWQREAGETLERFCTYQALHEHFLKQDAGLWGWPVWPQEYRTPDSPQVAAFVRTHRNRIDLFAWLQWQCERQLEAAGTHAWNLGLGVGVYQDLAVSVDRAGAETWAFQDLYAADVSVGAPPDDFSLQGQNWGLPPMVPHRLQELCYEPFIALLRANMRAAGALRIDHAMGLMRLFWIPPNAPAAEGTYVQYPLRDLLAILALESQRNQCLIIGEDLGTVPDELHAALAPLGVLSYRLLLFEKEGDGSYKLPEQYPRQALVAPSTHDLPTLAGFWVGHDLEVRARLGMFPSESDRSERLVRRAEERVRLLLALERTQLLPEGMTVHPVGAPEMNPQLALAIFKYLARTPSQVMVIQPEDIFGVLDQINLPGTTEQHPNWRRKLPLNIEQWLDDARLPATAEALREERGGRLAPREDAVPAVKVRTAPIIPRATYRMQFNRGFTFRDAQAAVPYLHRLGVSHLYASPYLKARPGSPHGYDIIDHNSLNPEIGSLEEFEAMVASLKANGMGQLLDVVPNHMGVMGADNLWWLDVLENGPASAYADFFDIDWRPAKPSLHGKVLIPVLGDQYGITLERGELKLVFDEQRGELSVCYYHHRFPVDPREYPRILGEGLERLDARIGAEHADALELRSLVTALSHLPARGDTAAHALAERQREKELHKQRLAALYARSADVAHFIKENVRDFGGTPGEPSSFDRMHALLEAQAYRLAYWRVASDDINYRRFFDINDLAALRMENPRVFAATHRLLLEWLDAGKIDALRIDHPDGLYDPAQYFARLQARAASSIAGESAPAAAERGTYVVVEKILVGPERLPLDWPVFGTTGYDFCTLLNGVFVDPAAATSLEQTYRGFIGQSLSYTALLYQCKRLIMRTALAGELNVLANALLRIAEADRRTCDFTFNSLRYALREIVASFPVYRTYVAPGHISEVDRVYIDQAVDLAKTQSRAGDVSVFDFVREVMLTAIAEGRDEAYREAVLSFAMKLQQYTAPVMAKGMEDTTFYIYARLASLNEVGGDPRTFGVPMMAFHLANRERQRHWPHSLLATSTHDSKRAEDVRTRIDVLSELPEEWRAKAMLWQRLNRNKKQRLAGDQAPDRNDEYLLYQTLIGAWPLNELDAAGMEALRGRIRDYMLKAIREAKVHTSWIRRNERYEQAVVDFVDALLMVGPSPFLQEFLPFQRKIARLGMYNSLSQVLLKFTVPGVPDLYQGTELWAFDLVDPDNRRPVDYRLRTHLLDEMASAAQPDGLRGYVQSLLDSMPDGRIKLYFTWKLLTLRNQLDAVFRFGEYAPLRVSGAQSDAVIAFSRSYDGTEVLVAASRWFARLGGANALPVGAAAWSDTRIDVPSAGAWSNVLTGERVQLDEQQPVLALAEAFATMPWGVWARQR